MFIQSLEYRDAKLINKANLQLLYKSDDDEDIEDKI